MYDHKQEEMILSCENAYFTILLEEYYDQLCYQ